MAKRPFTRDQFLQAGIKLLEASGYGQLNSRRHRTAIFVEGMAPDGKQPFVARFRTTMDRGLLANAKSNEPSAPLNLEGEGLTHVLLMTTKVLREKSPLEGYLIPLDEAVSALQENHSRWLATNPKHMNPDGSQTRWISLDSDRLSSTEFASRLTIHRLEGEIPADDPILRTEEEDTPKNPNKKGEEAPKTSGNANISAAPLSILRDAFKQAVAREHGVEPDQVNLKIEILT